MTLDPEPQSAGDRPTPRQGVAPPLDAPAGSPIAGSGTSPGRWVPVEPVGRTLHRRSPDELPRLLLWWCLWLLSSWVLIRKVVGFHLRELPNGIMSAAGPPSVRWMMFASLAGLMLLWPLYRLSQRQPRLETPVDPRRVSGVLLDWFGLMLMFQVVLWPLHRMGEWTLMQTAWIDTLMAAWSLLSGVILVWGVLGSSAWRRTMAMVLCVALLFAEPALMGISTALGSASWSMCVSPISTLWALTMNKVDFVLYPAVWHVTAGAIAAFLAWLITLFVVGRKVKRAA